MILRHSCASAVLRSGRRDRNHPGPAVVRLAERDQDGLRRGDPVLSSGLPSTDDATRSSAPGWSGVRACLGRWRRTRGVRHLRRSRLRPAPHTRRHSPHLRQPAPLRLPTRPVPRQPAPAHLYPRPSPVLLRPAHHHRPQLGQPLCLDCYDHQHQVMWNATAGELWRHTCIATTRALRRVAKAHGIDPKTSSSPTARSPRCNAGA
jgi:hypothetical protein